MRWRDLTIVHFSPLDVRFALIVTEFMRRSEVSRCANRDNSAEKNEASHRRRSGPPRKRTQNSSRW